VPLLPLGSRRRAAQAVARRSHLSVSADAPDSMSARAKGQARPAGTSGGLGCQALSVLGDTPCPQASSVWSIEANPGWPHAFPAQAPTLPGFPIVFAKFKLLRNYTFFHNEF
jgi:hypothetical protein